MRRIKVAGIDPSLTNTGIALGYYDLDTGKFEVEAVHLICTETETGKTVRRNSDDLRRCSIITTALYGLVSDVDVIFSEIPTGAQSARAAFAFGMVIGLMAGVVTSPDFKPAFIQVLPQQVKLAIPGGSKVTSKEEIIEWATKSWPNAGWDIVKGRKFPDPGCGFGLGAAAEHPADACAAINAGLLTDDFRNLLSLFKKLTAPQ